MMLENETALIAAEEIIIQAREAFDKNPDSIVIDTKVWASIIELQPDGDNRRYDSTGETTAFIVVNQTSIRKIFDLVDDGKANG